MSADDRQAAMDAPRAQGPLAGLRVVEFAGLGPAPFACMLLSDMGADVVTVERPGKKLGDATDIVGRGRSVVVADLKNAADREAVKALLEHADVLVEGFRPGVMERLGLGPDALALRNPALIYGRMTGWGQTGPLAQAAGHDLNYIALTGALHAIGPVDGPPVPPLNLVGDYAGGSLYLVCGILAALHERERSGRGQTIDAAITDGTLSLMSLFVSGSLRGSFVETRGRNLLDGGAPFYGVYETLDARHVSIGALEPQFFARLCELVGVAPGLRAAQSDRSAWPAMRAEFERIFRMKTQAEWTALLEGSDACFAPVLPLSATALHPHMSARESFVRVGETDQPAPAPRFSRTPSKVQGPAASKVTAIDEVARRWLRPTGGG
jgi:alpha-methylacyl-CoA racemase